MSAEFTSDNCPVSKYWLRSLMGASLLSGLLLPVPEGWSGCSELSGIVSKLTGWGWLKMGIDAACFNSDLNAAEVLWVRPTVRLYGFLEPSNRPKYQNVFLRYFVKYVKRGQNINSTLLYSKSTKNKRNDVKDTGLFETGVWQENQRHLFMIVAPFLSTFGYRRDRHCRIMYLSSSRTSLNLKSLL